MALRVLRTLGTCPLFPTPPFPNADIHPAPDDFAAIMISPESYRAILSGQRRDLLAVAARGMLSVAEVPYRAAMACRNRRYERGWAEIHRVSVPVVSVGNLTVGGTGKTPFVAWLAQWFRDQGIRVSLVSRGYGGQTGGGNDEARELEQRLPDVPHVQSPDRVAAARIAIDELATQLIILDDGFQHRRIGRDLDVVLIDATQPFGYGHVLPRGLMRESKRGLSRADVVALTRANLVSAAERADLRREVERLAPNAGWIEVEQRAAGLRSASGQTVSVDSLPAGSVLAFCGIGNPAAFRQTLVEQGWAVRDFRAFADHCAYDSRAIEELLAWTERTPDASAVLCTHKDLVKVGVDRLGNLPLYALTLSLQVSVGLEGLEARLRDLLAKTPRD